MYLLAPRRAEASPVFNQGTGQWQYTQYKMKDLPFGGKEFEIRDQTTGMASRGRLQQDAMGNLRGQIKDISTGQTTQIYIENKTNEY
jgi:hypothetical protein